ncbi:hypothetical protein [Streptomyces aquilus]|uniref:hypothetical protein n=1 Tax=Streptomyces aquilus TaxID=2548456 RepID=UPI001FCB66AE|nr:hypothetical protein [Streptomyces aquilus]
MRTVGTELAVRLTETVRRLDLDNRELPVDRGQDEEEVLARMLIAAAWYQALARTPIGFAFTLTRLLKLPHRDLVADVTATTRPRQSHRLWGSDRSKIQRWFSARQHAGPPKKPSSPSLPSQPLPPSVTKPVLDVLPCDTSKTVSYVVRRTSRL